MIFWLALISSLSQTSAGCIILSSLAFFLASLSIDLAKLVVHPPECLASPDRFFCFAIKIVPHV